MNHRTILAFDDPKFRPVRELVTDFEGVDSTTTTQQRRLLVDRGRQWGLGKIPQDVVSIRPSLLSYADKCARFAYKVYDEEVDALRAEGATEAEIVEVTLAASLGVSLARLERGLALLDEEGGR